MSRKFPDKTYCIGQQKRQIVDKVSRQFALFWIKFIFLVLFLDKSCIMVAMAEKGPLQGQRANA